MTARDDAIEAALDQMWTCCADCAKETVNRDTNRPEAERLVDAVESIIRADERERIAQEIQVIHIPVLSDYGPTGAANWMRYEAWRIARGGESG